MNRTTIRSCRCKYNYIKVVHNTQLVQSGEILNELGHFLNGDLHLQTLGVCGLVWDNTKL